MKITVINGSPKTNQNNSGYFLSLVTDSLKHNYGILESCISEYRVKNNSNDTALLNSIFESNAIVIAFPLYIDSIPSHIIPMLEAYEKEYADKTQYKKSKVYMIINCGFYESRHNFIAIEIIKNWCVRSHLEWGQCIAIGAGEMIGSALPEVPLGKGPKKSLGIAINQFTKNIVSDLSASTILVRPNYFPRVAYQFAGNASWTKTASANGVQKKEIYTQRNTIQK